MNQKTKLYLAVSGVIAALIAALLAIQSYFAPDAPLTARAVSQNTSVSPSQVSK